MEITFKNATSNDIDRIVELNRKLIMKYETNLNLDFKRIFDWIKKKAENNIDNYQCVYLGKIKVGYFFLHDKGGELELDDLFIFDEFQGRGIRTYILKYAASIAKGKNKAIFLYVFAKNYGAINLYTRNGYKISENISNSRYIMRLCK
ncbi:MAG TPA: N-acetyltransferase [Clostridiaceae bacterium]|nr:N-acetyltransferase [Clostridiaceae bacterium]HBF78266.1 N-acetyltransferase [Clostridiaceae bacterium]HBG38161.1 N-acetyltransferase [Clostridiaceae bacterium]HBN28205.1 N-acetyltransferase [Clostridiaceae bacterium]HBX47920.1 N-acetyltransferase [Clostridiaceae bacterium]